YVEQQDALLRERLVQLDRDDRRARLHDPGRRLTPREDPGRGISGRRVLRRISELDLVPAQARDLGVAPLLQLRGRQRQLFPRAPSPRPARPPPPPTVRRTPPT